MRLYSMVLAIAMIIFLCSGAYAARMYSWVDENGITHLSNKPPSANAKNVREFEIHDGETKPIINEEIEKETEVKKPGTLLKKKKVNKLGTIYSNI